MTFALPDAGLVHLAGIDTNRKYLLARPYSFQCLALSHGARRKIKLLLRVRRICGQVEAIEQALETGMGLADVLHPIKSELG
ncbi:metal-sensing transcriptional repressor [Massilia sp. DD77]